MPNLTRIKSFFRYHSDNNPQTTRQPATTNDKQPYTRPPLGATAMPDAKHNLGTSLGNRQVETTSLLTTQNWINENTIKIYFVPELRDLANCDKNTFIDSPLFIQPETVEKYIQTLTTIDSLTPEGASFDTITENIERFSQQMTKEDFFWVTALKFSFTSKLMDQLKCILNSIKEGANLPEEDVIGRNLTYRANERWRLKVNKPNITTPMTTEEKNIKANSISSTFQLLINRLFQDMSDKVYQGDFEIENAEKYRNLIQEITTITIPMRRNYDSIETKIATINIVHEDIKNMIGNLKRLLSLS
jgi:hypothetical protein